MGSEAILYTIPLLTCAVKSHGVHATANILHVLAVLILQDVNIGNLRKDLGCHNDIYFYVSNFNHLIALQERK